MQVLVEGEAECLEQHVRESLIKRTLPAAGAPKSHPEPDPSPSVDWLRCRFREPLERDASAGPTFGKAATAIGVTTIGAGLASSAAASAWGDDATVLVAGLGILVGLLTAVNQIWRPSQRSVARYQAAFALRREGWDFVQDSGRYSRLAPDVQVQTFVEEVNRIHRAVESIDEATSPSQSGG